MAITLEELAKEVQKLKDIEEIKVLKARYSDMCDSNHDWTQIKDLFAPDAKWIGDPTQPWGGGNNREEIEKLFQFYQTQMDGVPGVGVLGHNPMAPQITVADDGRTRNRQMAYVRRFPYVRRPRRDRQQELPRAGQVRG